MAIRKSEYKDIERMLEIYAYARQVMADNGNPHQWGDEGYPKRELLENDIDKGISYVMEDDAGIYGVFTFIIGEDPTYTYIENGQWLNDNLYGTIHRIASDGSRKGLLKECVAFCESQIDDLRIDTHHDNLIMQHLIPQCGFIECGVIYVADGTPRKAYQK